MGMSSDAILAYGYNLGGADDEWHVEQVNEDGYLTLDWLNDEGNFVNLAEKRLLATVGFTETDYRADGYFRRESEAKARLGLEFGAYCHCDYPMWMLSAKAITVDQGDLKVLDLAALDREAAEQGWAVKLDAAMKVLGLTPKQQVPGWLLCSYWG